jgi:2-isopropylmalate synthase
MTHNLHNSLINVPERKIIILDTTLRDGDQSPGMAFSAHEKLEIAILLERLGVDIIEAGFPASSRGEYNIVREITSQIKNSIISVMARSIPGDIEKAAGAIKDSVKKHLHLTMATSPIHRKYKLNKSKDEIIKMAADSVKFAKSFADSVEIGAEDSTRTEFNFLCEFCIAVTEAGADVVNISDTVGYSQPDEFFRLIKNLRKHVHAFGSGSAVISVHCHNDLGMATANTLSGILAGASQAETTLLGIGERAGNAAMEEVVTALNIRKNYYSVSTGIRSELFPEAARLISRVNAIRVHPCKPVVGSNVYSHSAGIHQHGMAMNDETYSIIKPAITSTSRFILSRHSGLKGLKEKIKQISGIELNDKDAKVIYSQFKKEADKKKSISSTDILKLLHNKGILKSSIWSIKKIYYFDVKSSEKHEFSVFLELINQDGMEKKANAVGMTKWEAIIKALKLAFHFDIKIIDFSSSLFADESALSERLHIETEFEGNIYADESFGSDSLVLFVESYLNIVNQIIVRYQFTDSV